MFPRTTPEPYACDRPTSASTLKHFVTHNTALHILGQTDPPAAPTTPTDPTGPTGPAGPGVHPLAGPLAADTASGEPPTSLYIHIPFCFHKCHYCDFYSIVDTQDRQQEFTRRLIRELAALSAFARGRPLRTIFVGGGTPSLLAPRLWTQLLGELRNSFDLSIIDAGLERGGEFTVECNPETVTSELMEILRGGGVSRVSLGAQSFEHRHLKTLERWHDPANVAKAVEFARAAGIQRRSIDLIFGIPGQTVAEWMRDLATAISLGTEHLSCYGLTYEPGTAMTARLARGEFTPADEDAEADMFEATVATLRAAGLERYEVSNFARPGAECLHNMVYWRQGQWLAAGPSASAHVAGHRWKNVPRLGDYLAASNDGLPPVIDHEGPDASRAAVERIMTGLRLAEGLESSVICSAVGEETAAKLMSAAESLRRDGWLKPGDRWTLTDRGFLFTNRAILRLAECID